MGLSDVAVKHMRIKRIANAHHAVGDNLPLEREDGLPCVQASMMVPVQAAPCKDHKPYAEPAWAAHPSAIQLDIQHACHQNRVRLRRTYRPHCLPLKSERSLDPATQGPD